jgi:NAD(P)-dependent dehydrogenase (short-subunit alcohol dehydrogenase family)
LFRFSADFAAQGKRLPRSAADRWHICGNYLPMAGAKDLGQPVRQRLVAPGGVPRFNSSMAAIEGQRLSGKVAIVTGAGSRAEGIGNGRATAILLARHGARVALLDAIREWAEATARMIEAERGECVVLAADVTDPAACAGAVEQTVARWGGLDILVNNVGIAGPPGTAVEVDPAAWDQAMRINVTSMMLMAKYAIPEMRKRGSGAIVNIASVAGLTGGHPNLLYPTSKGAVVNLTRAMAAHHGEEGIRVNCIAPGMVYTPMVYSRGMTPEMREARRNRSLLKTEGTGWDVGNAVLYLASDEARWVTGIVLPVDAGATAGASRVAVPPSGSHRA